MKKGDYTCVEDSSIVTVAYLHILMQTLSHSNPKEKKKKNQRQNEFESKKNWGLCPFESHLVTSSIMNIINASRKFRTSDSNSCTHCCSARKWNSHLKFLCEDEIPPLGILSGEPSPQGQSVEIFHSSWEFSIKSSNVISQIKIGHEQLNEWNHGFCRPIVEVAFYMFEFV